jgi:hypothetical protein
MNYYLPGKDTIFLLKMKLELLYFGKANVVFDGLSIIQSTMAAQAKLLFVQLKI